MLTHTKAIVFSALKYQDKALIVKCFTLSDGLKSYFIPNAFSSKKNNQKTAYFQPLTVLEIVAFHKNKGNLEHFKEVKLGYHFQSIPVKITKSTLLLFLAEIISNTIKTEEKDEALFYFIEEMILQLDQKNEIGSLHLKFLVNLTHFLGFYPQQDSNGDYFDVYEGRFEKHQGTRCLSKEDSKLLLNLLQESDLTFTSYEKKRLLECIMLYYQTHLEGFKNPKSLSILQEVFQ